MEFEIGQILSLLYYDILLFVGSVLHTVVGLIVRHGGFLEEVSWSSNWKIRKTGHRID